MTDNSEDTVALLVNEYRFSRPREIESSLESIKSGPPGRDGLV